MKKLLLLLLTLVITRASFAQFFAYFPDGKRINIRFNTIQSLLDSLGAGETESYDHKLGHIYFKRLTNKPIFVLFIDKPYPLKITEIIQSYPYSKYLNSYSYYWDLKDMIKSGTLTKNYLINVFKEPDSKGVDDNGSEFWIYKKYNAKINFAGEMANSANVMNYNAMLRNELAITEFEVTRSDYTIGFGIGLSNFSKKTIKYVHITVTITNSVDDKVGTKTVKGVGPIKSGEHARFEFKDILYSRIAEYVAIDLIKIQYMDGTFRTIPKNEIQNIRIHDWEEIGNRTAGY